MREAEVYCRPTKMQPELRREQLPASRPPRPVPSACHTAGRASVAPQHQQGRAQRAQRRPAAAAAPAAAPPSPPPGPGPRRAAGHQQQHGQGVQAGLAVVGSRAFHGATGRAQARGQRRAQQPGRRRWCGPAAPRRCPIRRCFAAPGPRVSLASLMTRPGGHRRADGWRQRAPGPCQQQPQADDGHAARAARPTNRRSAPAPAAQQRHVRQRPGPPPGQRGAQRHARQPSRRPPPRPRPAGCCPGAAGSSARTSALKARQGSAAGKRRLPVQPWRGQPPGQQRAGPPAAQRQPGPGDWPSPWRRQPNTACHTASTASRCTA
jgi:hypothetical protein